MPAETRRYIRTRDKGLQRFSDTLSEPLMLKKFFLFFAGIMFLVPGLRAADVEIRGRISNGTTAKAGAADEVVLYRLDQGMNEAARIADVRGSFQLRVQAPESATAYLLQAMYQGVSYNVQVNLGGEQREAEITIPVYDTAPQVDNVSIRIPHLFIQRTGNTLTHRLLMEVDNRSNPPRTWHDPDGTFMFRVPEGISGDVTVSVSTGSMPLQVTPRQTDVKNVYAIDQALKPGTSNISITYSTDYADETYHLSMPVYYPLQEINLFVAPPDITVSAPGFDRQTMDESQGFSYFLAANIEKGEILDIHLSGGSTAAPQGGQASQRVVSEANPPINTYSIPLIVTFALILAFGSAYLFQWEKIKKKDVREREDFRRSLSVRRDKMIAGIAELDRRFGEHALAEDEYASRRAELKERLTAILEQLESFQKQKA